MYDFKFTISNEESGQRLDKFLSENIIEMTRNALVKQIEQQNISVNGKPSNKKYIVKTGDIIEAYIPDPVAYEVSAENIPLKIIYEDDDLLIIDKPKGMTVHPGPGNYSGTLVNALMYHCGNSLSGINGVMRPGIVHRIDKNTSGLLVAAKTDFAHNSLAVQLKEHKLCRKYIAVVKGNIKQNEGTVCAPVGRSSRDRKKMAVTDKNSKRAVTHYKVLERFGGHTRRVTSGPLPAQNADERTSFLSVSELADNYFTLIECQLETGRTHQIRVHMAYIGHPIAGDDVYGAVVGKAEKELCGQCLHAKELHLTHPRTQENKAFISDMPDYFSDFLLKLRFIFGQAHE